LTDYFLPVKKKLEEKISSSQFFSEFFCKPIPLEERNMRIVNRTFVFISKIFFFQPLSLDDAHVSHAYYL